MSLVFVDMENILRRSFYETNGDVIDTCKMFFLGVRGFLKDLNDPSALPIFLTDDYTTTTSWRTQIHKDYALSSSQRITKAYIESRLRGDIVQLIGSYGLNLRVAYNAEWYDLLLFAAQHHLLVEPTFILSNQLGAYQFARDDRKAPVLVYQFVLNEKKEFSWTRYTKTEVETMFQIPIDTFPFYIALHGDKAHNVQGVYGVGPKRGQKLVQQMAAVYPDIPRVTEITDIDASVLHTFLHSYDRIHEIVQCYHQQYIPEAYRITWESPVVDLFVHDHKGLREAICEKLEIPKRDINELTAIVNWNYEDAT